MPSKFKESNTQLLLGKILNERHQALDPNAQLSSFFEYIVASELLKAYDLSIDEIREGIVGGGMDGGIDGFYALVSDEPLNDSHLAAPPRRPTLDVLIFQAKLSPSFSGLALDKIISTI